MIRFASKNQTLAVRAFDTLFRHGRGLSLCVGEDVIADTSGRLPRSGRLQWTCQWPKNQAKTAAKHYTCAAIDPASGLARRHRQSAGSGQIVRRLRFSRPWL